MGGGAAMRAAAKVAGIGAVSGGFRSFPAVSPVENQVAAAALKTSRPASSAIVSSSEDVKPNVALQKGNVDRLCLELNDWELAGGDEELVVAYGEPMPRVVFGGAPTLQEAKEATDELKDALEKVYLSSPNHTGSGGSYILGEASDLLPLSNSESLVTKACVTGEISAAPNASKNAIQAFRFLSETPAAQTVVASIASDPSVWNAVLQNPALVEYLESHKTNVSLEEVPNTEESAAYTEFSDKQSVKSANESGELTSGNGFVDFWQNVRLSVVDMMKSLSDYFQSLFGVPAAEKVAADADKSAWPSLLDKSLGATFMGLAVMVIMVVVLKRA